MKVDGEVVEDQKTVETSKEVTLSYVGSVIEDRKPCRWLEVKTVTPEEEGEKIRVHKMLVTEAALLQNNGNVADAHILRAWSRRADGTIVRLEKDRGPAFLLFGTPGAEKHMALSSEKRDFSYPSHQLEAAQSRQGTFQKSHSFMLGLVKVRSEGAYTAWFHPDFREGFVGLDWKGTVLISGPKKAKTKMTTAIVYRVDDAGTGAQSELPDHN